MTIGSMLPTTDPERDDPDEADSDRLSHAVGISAVIVPAEVIP
jgi:hypothetical protein